MRTGVRTLAENLYNAGLGVSYDKWTVGPAMCWCFNVTAPAIPGGYVFQWQMLQEGI